MSAPYLGNCLCGIVKFQLNTEPITCYACHCTDCQRRSGGPLLLSMWVARDSIEVLEGNPEVVSSVALDGRERKSKVCRACEIRLWAEPTNHPKLAILRPSTLEQSNEFPPIAHQFVRSAMPWFVFPRDVACYQTIPPEPSELARLWRESKRRSSVKGET